jgi:DNA-binding NarL/FixJ family response regulator
MPQPSAAGAPTPIRVLLVEDHDMVAEAIGLALTQAEDIEIVTRSRSAAEGLSDTRRHQPDVVVLDRRLPDGDGVALIGDLTAAAPHAKVLILTGEASPAVAVRVIESGGAGLVLKSARLADLTTAVRQVAAGELSFAAGILTGVLDRLTGRDRAGGRAALTAREQEVLVLLSEGAGIDEISGRLRVARNTVRNHVQRILEKLGARSRLEAVVIARRNGLLD